MKHSLIGVATDLFVDGNGGFVRQEPLYYLFLKHTSHPADVLVDADPDAIRCERGWFNSASKDCPEPVKLTAKQVTRISSALISEGVNPLRLYTINAPIE
jgi:hypothetical protein